MKRDRRFLDSTLHKLSNNDNLDVMRNTPWITKFGCDVNIKSIKEKKSLTWFVGTLIVVIQIGRL